MATIAPNGNLISMPSRPRRHANERVQSNAAVRTRRARKISLESGRAIEMLGHAIEYLADEFALDCMSAGVRGAIGPHPRMAAIELLMARNREIYLSCPELPTFRERLKSLFSFHMA